MSYKLGATCLKASTIALFLLFFQALNAQKVLPSIVPFIEQRSTRFGTDFTVAVVTKDTIAFQKEWGAMKAKTVAPLGSSSGWLTAALFMQFVDEGKLSLDDKVVKYLPVFEKYGKNYITLRHCLAHLTGIQADGKLKHLLASKKFSTLDEEVNHFAANEIETNPGTAFTYNEIGMSIAGRVLEVVSKKRFDLLIKQKLLTPLGMRQTSFTSVDGTAPDPFAGGRTTATDYMAFLKMLLNNGRYNGQQVLSEAAVMQLRTIQTTNVPLHSIPKEAAGFAYTLGAWSLESNSTNVTVLASPNFTGTWPVVDFCRGYALLLFTKNTIDDQKGEHYADLKKLIDQSFTNACR
ncbi:MAG TPA: serine hydrolase [Chitinophagaceae bacterium]|nr:serine hydrolase [Chitinophagaceae bacterium]